MKRHILMLTTCAFILACGAAGASAEESTSDRSHEGYGMMGHGGMMGCGMMRRGGMMGGGGMMGHGAAMRFIFALMDSDGDGTVSLQEFQAAHEKIFKAMDTDKDGTLTLEEIQAFMRGAGKAAQKENEHEHE
jgi:EF hand